jgi:integrase
MAAGQIRNRGRRRDGSTKWEARYWDRNQPDLRHQRMFRTKSAAQDWLTQQQHAQLEGTHTAPHLGNTTFATLATVWQEQWLNLEPKTQTGYTQLLNTHLLPEFSNTPIRNITPQRVQTFISQLSRRREPGTVRNVYACLRNCLNTAVRLRMLPSNPCAARAVKLPRSHREEMLFLTPQEITALATAVAAPIDKDKRPMKPRPEYATLILVAAYTGLRAGELLALTRADVDLLHSRIFVRRALKDVHGTLSFGPTKTHAHRTVSLPKFLVQELETHLTSPTTRIAPEPDALVFPNDSGGPLRHNNFYRRHFQPATRRALPQNKSGFRFHDLRHTCASLLIEQGVHAKAIQERLGHSSIQITMDRYGHLMESAYQSVADALDVAFAQNVVTLDAEQA